MGELSKLKNISKATEALLNEVGIYSIEGFRDVGCKEAFLRICEIDEGACLSLLYILSGALEDKRCHDLDEETKKDLQAFFKSAKSLSLYQSYKLANIKRMANIDEIPAEFSDDPKFQTALKTVYAGDYLGSEKLYVNIDYIKQGAQSAKYHSHSLQEEFFLILSGEGTLRMGNEICIVKKGDVISKPAGRMYTHQFINTGTDIMQILDIGTRETGDIVYYPDEDVVLFRDEKKAFSKDRLLEGWSSDPNLVG